MKQLFPQIISNNQGYISLIVVGVVLLAALLAGGISSTTDVSPIFNTGHFISGTPIQSKNKNSLQFSSLLLVTDTPTPTPPIQGPPPPTGPDNPTLPPSPTGPPGNNMGLHVQGNKLVNTSGQTVILRGVNRSGTEYMCVNSTSIFDGPSDLASFQTIASWHVHVVRVPLNEDCWLGINGVTTGGITYQNAIKNYVATINQAGLYVVLDLHWNGPGTTKATAQQVMADRDHAPAFWTSVANTFKSNTAVLFDLYNEPHDISWTCWKNGGTGCGASWVVAGMQEMVTAIRGTGATNVLMLGGLAWSNDISQWLTNKPADPQNNLVAAWHVYNFNACTNTGCYNSTIAPVATQVPVIAGEMGENDCNHTFIDGVMSWLDGKNQSYIGWTWNTGSCTGWPSLIQDYNGTPSGFGIGLKNHLLTFP